MADMWKGLAEVRPLGARADFPDDSAGAFVSVGGKAASTEAFRERVAEACRIAGLELIGLEDIEPVTSGSDVESVLRSELEQNPSSIGFGEFHTYPFDA